MFTMKISITTELIDNEGDFFLKCKMNALPIIIS